MTTLVSATPTAAPAPPEDAAPAAAAPHVPILLPVLVAVGLCAAVVTSTRLGVPHRLAAVGGLTAIALVVALTRRGEAVRLPGGTVLPVGRAVLAVSVVGAVLLGARWVGALQLPFVRAADLGVAPPRGLLLAFTAITGCVLGWLLAAPVVPPEDAASRTRLLALCNPAELAELRGLPDFARFAVVGALDALGSVAGVQVERDGALQRACAASGAQVLVVGRRQLADGALFAQLPELQARGVRVRLVADFIEEFCQRVPLEHIEPRWFLFDVAQLHATPYRLARSLVDLLAGLVGLAALVVVGPLVAAAVRLTSPGPALYWQERVGQSGSTFMICKFRTMTVDAESGGARQATTHDARVTPVGRFLRRSRLDELPQAWNLLRREMALIGPRPERPSFVAAYARSVPWYTQRHLVRPGLTGWAQVTEGYTSDVAGTVRKLERDLYYLKHQGPRLDLAILAATAQSVLRLGGR